MTEIMLGLILCLVIAIIIFQISTNSINKQRFDMHERWLRGIDHKIKKGF